MRSVGSYLTDCSADAEKDTRQRQSWSAKLGEPRFPPFDAGTEPPQGYEHRTADPQMGSSYRHFLASRFLSVPGWTPSCGTGADWTRLSISTISMPGLPPVVEAPMGMLMTLTSGKT